MQNVTYLIYEILLLLLRQSHVGMIHYLIEGGTPRRIHIIVYKTLSSFPVDFFVHITLQGVIGPQSY